MQTQIHLSGWSCRTPSTVLVALIVLVVSGATGCRWGSGDGSSGKHTGIVDVEDDLWTADAVGGDVGAGGVGPAALFSRLDLPIFTVDIPGEDWKGALDDALICPASCDNDQPYLEAMVTYDNPVTGETEVWDEVGVRFRGNSSACEGVNPRIGLKFSFNEFVQGRRFHGVKKLNFLGTEGDNSLMREVLAYELLRSLGVPVAEADYALLSINGEVPRIYPLVQESDDKTFIEHAFPGEPEGHLYKIEGYCGFANFEYLGPMSDVYVPMYLPKAGADEEHLEEDLIPFLGCFTLEDSEDFRECFEYWADVDLFLTALAADLVMPDFDAAVNAGQNFSLYFRGTDGRALLIPWDKDAAFRTGYCREDDPLDCTPPWSMRPEGLAHLMSAYDEVLRVKMQEILLGVMSPEVLDARIDELEERLAPLVAVDPDIVAGVDGWDWDAAVGVLRGDVAERRAVLGAALWPCAPGEWTADGDWWCVLCNEDGSGYVSGSGEDVSDHNDCTADACDPVLGVTHDPLSDVSCWPDDDPCVSEGECVDGVCVGGEPTGCEDGAPCVVTICDLDGECFDEEIPHGEHCDDGNSMTPDDICLDGICVGVLDADGDGIPNHGSDVYCRGPELLQHCVDNCPFVPNPDQLDVDDDGIGDECGTVRMWHHVDTEEKVIALTFDDGWDDERLTAILDALDAEDAYATFFINGLYLFDGVLPAELVLRIRDEGHLLGNHTYNHTLGEDKDETIQELLDSESAFMDVAGVMLRPVFRSPAYAEVDWLDEALEETGYTENFKGSMDPQDWTDPPPDAAAMALCVSDQAEPGDIVVMHIGPATTPDAVAILLADLRDQGYSFLTLEQMLLYGDPVYEHGWPSKQCEDYYQ